MNLHVLQSPRTCALPGRKMNFTHLAHLQKLLYDILKNEGTVFFLSS